MRSTNLLSYLLTYSNVLDAVKSTTTTTITTRRPDIVVSALASISEVNQRWAW